MKGHKLLKPIAQQKRSIPKFAYAALAVVALATASLTGCTANEGKTVTIATHDSFVISEAQIAEFKKETGLTLKVVRAGDAGELTNKLVLTKGTPIADAYFGIDNTFMSKATANGVVSTQQAVDFGDVCMNYDTYWFEENKVAAPTNWQDLVKPEYQNLTVVENPNSSSTGLAFLATTVAQLGESYGDYWKALKDNGVKVTAGWEDAYFTEFSGSSGKGSYPIVLSYSTSPAYEIREDGKPQTASLNENCFRQTEFAGVLKNAKHPNNAQKVVDYLLGDSFQSSIAESMYVYPQELYPNGIPADWAKWGKAANSTVGQDLNFDADREKWLDTFNSIFG